MRRVAGIRCLYAIILMGGLTNSQTGNVNLSEMSDIRSVVSFGARGDGSTDNILAFQRAIDGIALDKQRGGRLSIPPGRFRLSAPLHISRGMILEGSSGAGRHSGTTLVFDAGIDGIIIDSPAVAPDGGAGDWAVIRDLAVIAVAPIGNSNGITLRARARVENVYVRGFGGNGIEIAAWARGQGPSTNANNWSLSNVFSESNHGNGIHVIGADANAGVAIAVSSMNNGGWGFLDESFLGNTYVGCHTESNKKGGYSVTNANARSIFVGCYAESGQPDNLISRPSTVIGGLFGKTRGSGFFLIDGLFSPNWLVRNEKDPKLITTLGFAPDVPHGIVSLTASDGSLPYRLEYQKSGTGWWDLNYGELGNGTALSFSTSKAEVGLGQVRFPNGFFVGQGANSHRFNVGLQPPSIGAHVSGEIVFSADPGRTGFVGWVAVKAGSPGEWVPFGALVRSQQPSANLIPTMGRRLLTVAYPGLTALKSRVTFDAARGSLQKVVLTADVTASDLVNVTNASHLDFLICQDYVGGHVFRWPENVRGGMRISMQPGSCSAQSFVISDGNAFATAGGGISN